MIKPTEKQRAVHDLADLDLLIVAPAGCGKTEALAMRVAGMLERGQVPFPRRVLVTTFTNRARENIRARLANYVSPAQMRNSVTVHNFHGLSARIVQAHSEVIGMDSGMQLPENDWVRIQCHARSLSWDQIQAVETELSSLKRQALSDDQIEMALIESGDAIALDIERQRKRDQVLTYDDLPRLAELILENPVVAGLYQNHFAALIVDEYQDLTAQQLRLVNRIGWSRTTYAGDLAQGIYSFAGAEPTTVDAAVRSETSTVIEFDESHRSSPAVLSVVNSLRHLTGGLPLRCAEPSSWPGEGLAGGVLFGDVDAEATFVVDLSRYVLSRAPNHRIGVIARTEARRRWVDSAVEVSGLEFHRWDDPLLDAETARNIKGLLTRLNGTALDAEVDPAAHLRSLANVDSIQDPSSREALVNAIGWCLDLLREGYLPKEVYARVRVGDEHNLLSLQGVHLLSGHVGKGQQFDWVLVIGAEDGSIPDFRAEGQEALAEEARVLSVMVSRARHGVVVSCAQAVPAKTGRVFEKVPSRFFPAGLARASLRDISGINDWLAEVDWMDARTR